MTNIIKVGQMPGLIREFAVTGAETFAEVLALAGLEVAGYEVKADSVKVEDLNKAVGTTSLVLLTKQIKGNATVKVGQMPGIIQELAVEPTATYAEVLAIAGLDANGYEVKSDSTKVTDLNTPIGTANLILLTKQIKGNATVKVGQMPGIIQELAVEPTATYAEVLAIAGLSADGYEVKSDSTKVTDLNAPIGTANLILLTKQIKGNFVFGGLKAEKVGNAIDAEVKAGLNVLSNAKLVGQQFDFVEQQLSQFAQLIGSSDPMAQMQFVQMQQQINNIQAQLVNAIKQAEGHFSAIDQHTNKIQN